MTPQAEQYPFVVRDPALGAANRLPYLPITLAYKGHSVEVLGLVDSGATVNVLPYAIGQQLGAVWEEQKATMQLAGSLVEQETRGLVMEATVGKFPAVRLVFAWTKSDRIPVILGHMNFFTEFDVCFFRSREVFEVKPKV